MQSFGVRPTPPDECDMLMDIANEEFSHPEIVGATITMLRERVPRQAWAPMTGHV